MTTVDPTTTNYTRALGVTVSEERWPAMSIVTTTTAAISLPAGRWLVTTQINSTPADIAAPPVTQQQDVTLASAGSITPTPVKTYVYRDLDGRTVTVKARVSVHRRSGSSWLPYSGTGVLTFTVPAAPASAQQTSYGANVHINIAEYIGYTVADLAPFLDQLVAAGGDSIRVGINCDSLIPTSHTFNAGYQAKIDAIHTLCSARSIKVYAIVGLISTESVASWLGGTSTNSYPANLSDINTFLTNYLTRWAPYAITLENEPNAAAGTGRSAVNYMRAHAQAWTTKQAVRPATKLYAGELANGDAPYLEAMYANGLAGKHDGIAIHPYHYRFDRGLLPEIGAPYSPWEPPTDRRYYEVLPAVHEVYKVMRANGEAAKPIIVNEGGWDSCGSAPNGARCSRTQQAAYLSHMLRQLGRCGFVDAVNTYELIDLVDHELAWSANFGLLTRSCARKPAWTSWKDAVAGVKAGTL